jgi:hypothetical protein
MVICGKARRKKPKESMRRIQKTREEENPRLERNFGVSKSVWRIAGIETLRVVISVAGGRKADRSRTASAGHDN